MAGPATDPRIVTSVPASLNLVIFDCDGVLVDSEKLAVKVEARLLTELGWALTENDVLERFVGRSDAYMLSEIEAHLGRSVPEWQAIYQRALTAAFEKDLTAVEGVEQALDQLDVPWCVASSGTLDKMRLTLGLTGLLPRFEDRLFSVTDVSRGKPEPDLFLHAAARCGTPPNQCVVVEDSHAGVEAARAAGMRCLAYAGGLTPAAWLEGDRTIVFDDMSLLPSLVAEMKGQGEKGRDRLRSSSARKPRRSQSR